MSFQNILKKINNPDLNILWKANAESSVIAASAKETQAIKDRDDQKALHNVESRVNIIYQQLQQEIQDFKHSQQTKEEEYQENFTRIHNDFQRILEVVRKPAEIIEEKIIKTVQEKIDMFQLNMKVNLTELGKIYDSVQQSQQQSQRYIDNKETDIKSFIHEELEKGSQLYQNQCYMIKEKVDAFNANYGSKLYDAKHVYDQISELVENAKHMLTGKNLQLAKNVSPDVVNELSTKYNNLAEQINQLEKSLQLSARSQLDDVRVKGYQKDDMVGYVDQAMNKLSQETTTYFIDLQKQFETLKTWQVEHPHTATADLSTTVGGAPVSLPTDLSDSVPQFWNEVRQTLLQLQNGNHDQLKQSEMLLKQQLAEEVSKITNSQTDSAINEKLTVLQEQVKRLEKDNQRLHLAQNNQTTHIQQTIKQLSEKVKHYVDHYHQQLLNQLQDQENSIKKELQFEMDVQLESFSRSLTSELKKYAFRLFQKVQAEQRPNPGQRNEVQSAIINRHVAAAATNRAAFPSIVQREALVQELFPQNRVVRIHKR